MHCSTIILSLGLAAINSVLAVPSAAAVRDIAESISNATALGVDVYGPIPSDAVQVDEHHWEAEPGTKAWAWIRAQIDLGADKEKRQGSGPANIGIGMFAQDWCAGQAAWFDDVYYNVNCYDTTNYYSVGISYRGLRDNEHLDFSKLSGNDWCGDYLYSAGYETPVGCFNSQAINCFRLWES